MSFADELAKHQERIGANKKEMAQILYDMPYRTYQDYSLGKYKPPIHAQKLILFRLESEPTRHKILDTETWRKAMKRHKRSKKSR